MDCLFQMSDMWLDQVTGKEGHTNVNVNASEFHSPMQNSDQVLEVAGLHIIKKW